MIMMTIRPLLFIGFLTAVITAAQAKIVSESGAWTGVKEMEGGKPVCVLSSKPQKAEGKYAKRGAIFALITHRPAEKRLGEVGFQAGYTFKKGSETTVTIDGKTTFKLFTNRDFAWTKDAKMDRQIAAAMRAGGTMIVNGTSSRGTRTRDTYSLKGFTAAYKAINKACGVQ